MRKIFPIFLLLISLLGCEAPDKVNFTQEALQDTFIRLETGEETTFESILKTHKGKTILIDIWASWCKDCIVGMPIVKQLQKDYPEVVFLFLSLDKNQKDWKKGIDRFKIQEGVHYFNSGGWKSPFNKSIDLDWIPRYIIVNPEGKMSLFEATKASDSAITEILNTLK